MKLYHFVIDGVEDAYFRASSITEAKKGIFEEYEKEPDFIEKIKD